MSKIFTFSDFVPHLNLLKDINNTGKKLSSRFSFSNCEKNFFNVVFPKKVVFFKNFDTSFYYCCDYLLKLKENENYQCIFEETYRDCTEIWDLYTKAKDFDFAKYKIIFYKFKSENLLNHLLYKICESPGSGSYLILIHILGYYNIFNNDELIFLTQDTYNKDKMQTKFFFQSFFTKEKLLKIYFMMTPENEEINNLLYALIFKEAEKYFRNYKKDELRNIELFNDIQEFSNLYLGHDNMTLNNFYNILLENSQFITLSGEEIMTKLYESVALLTNLDVKYSIGHRIVYFEKKNAQEMFKELKVTILKFSLKVKINDFY